MTIRHLYPAVEPSLNLDFANSKKLDPRITFTRASTGTYVGADGLIKTAAANQARFDHDGNGNSLGLLIEESRTNNQTYSQDFADASWLKLATVVPNAGLSPDGTSTASLVYPYVSGSSTYIYRSATSTSAIRTNTIYAKASGKSWLYLFDPTNTAPVYFNLADGTLGTVASGTSATISSMGNGWYRCSATNNTAGTFRGFFFAPCDTNNDRYSSASGTDGILVWGAQQEEGAFPTSYIPTTSSTVTRSADVASMTGTNFSSWYNQSEGTILISQKDEPDDPYGTILEIGGTTGGYVYPHSAHVINAPATTYLDIRSYFSNGGTPSGFFYAPRTPPATIAYAYEEGNYGLAKGGVSIPINGGGWNQLVPTVDSYLGLGRLRDGSSTIQLHIARLTYYPVRLPDATLQALTL